MILYLEYFVDETAPCKVIYTIVQFLFYSKFKCKISTDSLKY